MTMIIKRNGYQTLIMLQENKADHETEDYFPTCLQTEIEIVKELVQILQADKEGKFVLEGELNKS